MPFTKRPTVLKNTTREEEQVLQLRRSIVVSGAAGANLCFSGHGQV